MPARALLLLSALLSLALANNSTCGKAKGVKDCENIDFGSCGGACCLVDYPIGSRGPVNTTHVYLQVKDYLVKGGKDGSYAYVTGPDAAGHNPGDDLTKYPIAWDYIFQGTHTTTGGYVDTLKFNIGRVEAGKKTIMRIFSVSNVHGALGDNGQNYKNIAYILEGRGARIVHGCGAKAE